MKTLILAAIRCSLMFTAVTAPLLFVWPAQAGYIVTLEQVGSNVVATGSGPIDVSGLTFDGTFGSAALINPATADIRTVIFAPIDIYSAPIAGPTSFGSGGSTFTTSGSGDPVGITRNFGDIYVPQGYVSGNPLSDTMTFNDATFASLGVTPGTYVWTWGTGANQNFTLIIPRVAVPDSGSTVSLLGFGLLGLAVLRRKLS